MMDQQLDEQLLQEYMSGFFGYGDYAGRYWLVGIEEGGGDDAGEVAAKLAAWQHGGKKELEDIAVFHAAAAINQWFSESARLQPTWRSLIRLIQSAEGAPTDKESLRHFQRRLLGRPGGNNCVLELLPLPSPSTSHWHYGEWTAIDTLRDRVSYKEALLPPRIKHLQARLSVHSATPKLVVFYSISYRPLWEQITRQPFQKTSLDGLSLATEGQTVYALTRHPTAFGVTTTYFEEAGKILAEALRQTQQSPR